MDFDCPINDLDLLLECSDRDLYLRCISLFDSGKLDELSRIAKFPKVVDAVRRVSSDGFSEDSQCHRLCLYLGFEVCVNPKGRYGLSLKSKEES